MILDTNTIACIGLGAVVGSITWIVINLSLLYTFYGF